MKLKHTIQLAQTSDDAALLATLAADPQVLVRLSVAGNESATAATLAVLARDEEWSVRYAVSQNPATPDGAMTLLRRDPNVQIQRAIQVRRIARYRKP